MSGIAEIAEEVKTELFQLKQAEKKLKRNKPTVKSSKTDAKANINKTGAERSKNSC